MTTGETIIEIIRVVIYLGGIVGLGLWIKSLNGTIKAQGEILEEFKSLTSTMRDVVESTNAPKMLERVKAYEEFVDKEKEAAEAGGAIKQGMALLIREMRIRIDTFSKLIMYVSPGVRKEVIKSIPKPNYLTEEQTTAFYEKIAAVAPYLTNPRGEGGLLGSLLATLPAMEPKTVAETFSEGPPGPPEQTEPGQKLRERLTEKKDKE